MFSVDSIIRGDSFYGVIFSIVSGYVSLEQTFLGFSGVFSAH